MKSARSGVLGVVMVIAASGCPLPTTDSYGRPCTVGGGECGEGYLCDEATLVCLAPTVDDGGEVAGDGDGDVVGDGDGDGDVVGDGDGDVAGDGDGDVVGDGDGDADAGLPVFAPPTASRATSASGGQASSSRFHLRLQVGGPATALYGSTGRFKLNLGVGTPVPAP